MSVSKKIRRSTNQRSGSSAVRKVIPMVRKYEKLTKENVIKGKTVSLVSHEMQTKIQQDEETVMAFLSQWDMPHWLRGTSDIQINAANKLFYALRDDTEQNTTYRVVNCLRQIGIDPMVGTEEIIQLMKIARKNDLAFLWFLWEAHYKTSGPWYTINEQLILSLIAHLDMVTTFRELDRILPPGQPPKYEIARLKRLERLEKTKKKQSTRNSNTTTLPHNLGDHKVQSTLRNNPYKLPYFETQPKPNLQFTNNKHMYAPTPGFRVEFRAYERYSDPYYTVPNESNRWYSLYDLNPNRRIALNILTEELNTIFESFADDLTQNIVKLELSKIVEEVGDKGERVEAPRSLCAHHKIQAEREKILALEADIAQNEDCLKFFQLGKYRNQNRRDNIKKELEKAVDLQMSNNQAIDKFKSKEKAHVMILKGNADCDIQTIASSNGEEDKDSQGKPKCALKRKAKDYETDQKDKSERQNDRKSDDGSKKARLSDHFACQNVVCRENRTKGPYNEIEAYFSIENINNIDSDCCDVELESCCDLEASSSASGKFFEAPGVNRPQQFNYRKIFAIKEHNEQNMKATFEKAILKDVPVENKANKRKLDIDEAVKSYCKKVWQDSVHKKRLEIEAKEEEEANKTATVKASKKKSPLNYDQDYYDPDDKKLMVKMLKDALDYMKKNPKFVLASLPEAYKTPVLQEFVFRRFGKVYSTFERNKSYAATANIIEALKKLLVTIPLPNTSKYGTKSFGTYDCRKYYLRRLKKFKRDYYEEVDECIMELSRILWLAMRPYLCSNGPPRDTFFAYMPSRLTDIKHFRLWKKTEYRVTQRQSEGRRRS